MKKLKLKYYIALGALLIVGASAVYGGVRAFQSNSSPTTVVENMNVQDYHNEAAQPEATLFSDAPLGAVTGPDLPNPICINNLCTTVISGTLIDASTTLVVIPSPIQKATSTGAGAEVVVRIDDRGQRWTSATATIDFVHVEAPGAATTSYQFACGASATGFGTNLPLYDAIVTTSPAFASYIPTSTPSVVIENNLTALQGATIDSGTVNKITVNSIRPYLVCAVKATVASAFTNADNTFTGKYFVRFTWPRL